MQHLERVTARDIMSRNVVNLRADMSLREAIEILMEEQITGAPVIDAEQRLVGVLSLSDIASYEVGRLRATEPRRSPYFHRLEYERFEEGLEDEELPEEILDSTSVALAMTPMTITVGPRTPAVEIARIMVKERIHRVLVTERFKILGVVSSMDILKAVAETRANPLHRARRRKH
jgi:CBS-domain-containing membrane protein